jgi:hypothetical protein
MSDWLRQFKFDPLPGLVNSENKPISYFARRDVLGEHVESIRNLWELPEAEKIVGRQQHEGSWKYHSAKLDIRSQANYNLLETYRILGVLVEEYGFTREHLAIQKAADFLFGFQTAEGDFRGIFGNQYTPYYSAAIMELLIKAGYGTDMRLERGFRWLLGMRQDDGGWALPARTYGGKDSLTWIEAMKKEEPIEPDRWKLFSHMVTGVVLRAFAVHPKYRKTSEAKAAGELLKSRFFKPDKYPDRRTADFWTKFSYPFWFTDLLSSLDSLSQLGFTSQDPDVNRALRWFLNRQQANGFWRLSLLKTGKKDLSQWIALAICRVFKRFSES